MQETIVEGLIFEGGQWTDGAIKLSDELRNILPLAKLKWEQRSARVAAPTDGEVVTFPMYLNTGRTSLVVTVRVLTPPGGIPAHIWAQRGVAIIMQAPQ